MKCCEYKKNLPLEKLFLRQYLDIAILIINSLKNRLKKYIFQMHLEPLILKNR